MKLITNFLIFSLTLSTAACTEVEFAGNSLGVGDRKTDGGSTRGSEDIGEPDSGNAPQVPGEPLTGALDFTGTQINIDHQLRAPGATDARFDCDIASVTFGRPFIIRTRIGLVFDFTSITQVNCDIAAPANAKLHVHDASQANINATLAGADLTLENVVQTNLNLAIRHGVKYRFELQALQIGSSGCGPYMTTDPAAPVVRVRGSWQIGLKCMPESWAGDWYRRDLE